MLEIRSIAFAAALGAFAWGCHGELPPVVAPQPSDPRVGERIGRIENSVVALKPPPGVAAIPEPLGARMAFYQVPGVSVAVIRGFAVEWARSYGVRVRGEEGPVEPGTLFQAASVSKPVAAMAAIALSQRGLFGLDEDVNARLVSWRVPESQLTRQSRVTPRELLSHTAGLTVHGFNGYADGRPVPTLFQVLTGAPPANSAPVVVDTPPGSLLRYSGGGYCVLQQLMMDVTGRTFPEIMHAFVFTPLAMTRSTYAQPLPESWEEYAAVGHLGGARPVRGRWHTYPEMAAAGLWTTAIDLAEFAIEIQRAASGLRGKVLDPLWAREMLRSQTKNAGLGVFLAGSGEAKRFHHNGANAGYRSLLVAYPTGDGAVVMTNADSGLDLAEEIVRSVATEYGWPGYGPKPSG